MAELTAADIAALRSKYKEERDKRVGTSSREIPDLTGDLAKYLDDPYVRPTHRDPVNDHVEAVVVGAGLGGLMLGAYLREAGLERIRLVDAAGDVGGVWYWNRYPGAMCDIESLIYLPLLEELGYTPTMKYASAPEIQAYTQRIAKHYDLYDDALLQTAVTGMEWNDDRTAWTVRTDRGDEFTASYVILANGPLSRPKLPDIPGIETFKGHAFHTSRWDYSYTGGGPESPMNGLADKSVGIIGTGATGIQAVPPLGRYSKELFVFQRTPSTVGVRANGPIEPDWVSRQEPGWQDRRRRNFSSILAGIPVAEDLVGDGWTDLYKGLLATEDAPKLSPEEMAAAREQADFQRMESIRARIDAEVHDPVKAEALKPWYQYLCKRAGFHDEYLGAFNSPTVSIVDTDGRGIERVDETGVFVAGKHYALDLLVFATGFEFDTAYTRRIGFDVTGQDSLRLSEKWEDGVSTLHGLTTSGFPNLFVMPGTRSQSTVTANVAHSTDESARHAVHVIAELRRRKLAGFEVKPEAEQAWVDLVVGRTPDRSAFLEACTPGRYNNEGVVSHRVSKNVAWPDSPIEMWGLLADWRKRGDLEGMRLIGDSTD
ncbi:flavin-containing monooxygenase [Rhodococcoides fascians]|uniref:flavin-containing monooxygenase n=1 Tax=Rhodococcoides fascians TaxID=1828 RepID=UPI000565CF3B|nr:NAD(P)/FAD-dependent oxidoreductase [Rhodococcus fascians]